MTYEQLWERRGAWRPLPRRRVLSESFRYEHRQGEHIGIVNVERETRDKRESDPLSGGAGISRAQPIPEEKRHDERRMRVRPGRVEVHVHRERTGPPDGD